MPAKVNSVALFGLECRYVKVEVDITFAIPKFFIVGLPNKAIDESKERVRSSLKNAGFEVPRAKVTVNLAPADLKKEGTFYDLPIAMAILLASGQLKFSEEINSAVFMGELALDGSVMPVHGVLSVSTFVHQEGENKILYVPFKNAVEANLVEGQEIIPVKHLSELVSHFRREARISVCKESIDIFKSTNNENIINFSDIRGHEQVKRAVTIATAGGHNIKLSGPPGSGKTLIAKAIPGIMPDLKLNEALEVTRIYSSAGMLTHNLPLINRRPFRSPHHTASGVSLVGGGASPRPGEVSLAHRGVLFMDEFPEFPRTVLENLRQPLEDGVITVSRASGSLQFPANFILVAAMNPCPCGYASDFSQACTCTPVEIDRYRKRLSGPLLDRIDLNIEVPRVKFEKLTDDAVSISSQEVRLIVGRCRSIQEKRFLNEEIVTNSEMSSRQVRKYCKIDNQTLIFLREASLKLKFSNRVFFRILKISRTIADLANERKIFQEHVAEALQYRSQK
ncbi:magnesium chelatase [archaeon]|nr:magnesium chelatase [archaeon]